MLIKLFPPLLLVLYDGSRATLSYEAKEAYFLEETATYVGKNPLALDRDQETIIPQRFPIVHSETALSSNVVDTFEVSGFSHDTISVVAYATVCGVPNQSVEQLRHEEDMDEGNQEIASEPTSDSPSMPREPSKGVTCQSAYAYLNAESSVCFSNMGYPGSWGWSNGLLPPSDEDYSLGMYAFAEGCQISKGLMVGSLSVSNRGGGEVAVRYETAPSYWLKEVNTYIGTRWLPSVDGKQTVDPDLYPLQQRLGSEVSHTVTAPLSNGEPVVVVAHATVCGFFSSPDPSIGDKLIDDGLSMGSKGLRGSAPTEKLTSSIKGSLSRLANLW